MTKVYWPLYVRFVFSVMIIFILYGFFTGSESKSFNGLWIIVPVVIYFFAKILFASFFPSWAYGENGIKIFDEKGQAVKEYKWEEVLGIEKYYWAGARGGKWFCPMLSFKNGEKWKIWSFWTSNYRSVIKDVIGHVKKSSNGYVDPWVEKETNFWTSLFKWDL